MHDHRSKPTKAQLAWLHVLRRAGQRVYVWRPADQDAIVDVLRGLPNSSHIVPIEVGP